MREKRDSINIESVLIREPTKADVDRFHIFFNRLVEEDAPIAKNEPNTLGDTIKYLDDLLKMVHSGDAVTRVAVYHGRIVANCESRRLPFRQKHVTSLGLAVDHDFRGIGIGERIAREVFNQAKRMRGVKLFELSVFPINKPAISLYKKLGFKEVARVPGNFTYKGKPIDQIIMHCRLKKTDIP